MNNRGTENMCGPFLTDGGIIAAILLRIILLSEL
jgi:hypothetical protein